MKLPGRMVPWLACALLVGCVAAPEDGSGAAVRTGGTVARLPVGNEMDDTEPVCPVCGNPDLWISPEAISHRNWELFEYDGRSWYVCNGLSWDDIGEEMVSTEDESTECMDRFSSNPGRYSR